MDNITNIALSRLSSQQQAMDVVANNLANASTPGYRAERSVFADWLVREPAGAEPQGGRTLAFGQTRATYRERTEGTLSQTGNPLDLALQGDGYFTVQTQQGPRLTRAGRFTLGRDGTIADENGDALLDASGQKMVVSRADTDLTVRADGTLRSQNGVLGQIGVVAPRDPNRMTAEGSRLFRADVPTAPVAAPKMLQGTLEDSNVQPVSEITRMISTERDFQFVTQMVEAEGQRRQSAIDKIAAPAS
jgi:flagellar basal-body rod protein FlgF